MTTRERDIEMNTRDKAINKVVGKNSAMQCDDISVSLE